VKTAVVTGGAGAIGSRLVARLASEADRIVVIDDLSSGFRWLLPRDPNIELHVADIAEEQTWRDLDAKGAVVFHLAAFFANQNSVEHPALDLRTNGLGTLRALEWAQASECARFVFASAGCSIAGHDVQGPIRENMAPSLELSTPYQITKSLGEMYCNYFGTLGLPVTRARFFNSYGPGEVPGRYRNVIPNFFYKALSGEPLVITGTGEETRDFVYVDDLVSALCLLSRHPDACGEAFNIGTERPTTIRELAERIIALTASESPIEYAPPRPWDRSRHRQADTTKIQSLGFSAPVEVTAGLERTLGWMRSHWDLIRDSLR
jgi:UDP-glucose 4-epimerase